MKVHPSQSEEKSHKENQPKNFHGIERVLVMHLEISGTVQHHHVEWRINDGANGKSNDGWSAVTLSYHPVDFTNIRPTNYIKVSNIHKFNKPHFDPRAKDPTLVVSGKEH